MAAIKLFPPSIDGKLPAQVGNKLHIPYLPNRAVGINDFDSMSLKIKTISTNLDIAILEGDKNGNFEYRNNKLVIGQYYKAQLAYVSRGIVGHYSSVGIFKYTGMPMLTISSGGQDFEIDKQNYCGQEVIGKYYAPTEDINEKVYSYYFTLYENDEVLITSGELLHNSSKDESIEYSIDTFQFNQILNPEKRYSIQYTVTTLNGLKVASPKFLVNSFNEVNILFDFQLFAQNCYENGYIDIMLLPNKDYNLQGQFVLSRSNSLDDYRTKEKLKEFYINDMVYENIEYSLYKDFTTQQGVEYIYYLQQYNNQGVFTSPASTSKIYSDFEDAFLFDGERQLKIKFNPKITSIKDTILESKVDTIGGKFPFVFRNGNTKYKEFPISGLISYHMDNEQLFIKHENYFMNLTSENIAEERRFKFDTLEWLNNGKPKVFRSPAEGNYIVRLMNVSLSPNDTLGRMLHTFNCNAYEIASFNYDSLLSYNFIGGFENKNTMLQLYSIESLKPKMKYTFAPAIWARISGSYDTVYTLGFVDGTEMICKLGPLGIYETNFSDNLLTSISYTKSVGELEEHRIEYLTRESDLSNIPYGENVIKAVQYKEICDMYENDSEIIDKIIKTDELDNILVLNLTNILEPEDTTPTMVKIVFEDNSEKIIYLTNKILSQKDNNTEIFNGSLQLLSSDFGGRFVPRQIFISDGVRVDIYYRIKDIILQSSPLHYIEEEI